MLLFFRYNAHTAPLCGVPFIFFNLFTLVISDPADVRSPGHVCLALGASGYLGARQNRGPPDRGVAERAERVPAKLRVV